MLKLLLPSIQSKELLIEGRYYKVYEQVSLYNYSKQTALSMYLAKYNKRCYIKTFPKIKDPAEKDKAIHLYIEDILSEFHDYIEKHYVGDRFIKIDSLPTPVVSEQSRGGKKYVAVQYTVKRDPQEMPRNLLTKCIYTHVGAKETVSQKVIDLKIAEAKKRQIASLERAKIYVEQKRKAFREQVNKEIAERDSKLA